MWIRFFAWATILMVCLVSLFQIKHTAGKMDREARSLNRQIAKAEQSLEVLHAEWSHLNQPGYIASLAGRHLGYDPDIRTRIMNVDELPMRPVPVETTPTPNLSSGPSFAQSNLPLSEVGLRPSIKPFDLESRARRQRAYNASEDSLRRLTDDDPVGALIELYGN